MIVSELIAILQQQRPDAEVRIWHKDDASDVASDIDAVLRPSDIQGLLDAGPTSSIWSDEQVAESRMLLSAEVVRGDVWIVAVAEFAAESFPGYQLRDALPPKETSTR